MREMSDIFAGIGTIILTSNCFYLLSNIFNTVVFLACAFALIPFTQDASEVKTLCPKSVQNQTYNLAMWTMFTALIAVASLLSFVRFSKGSTLSVTGQFAYGINLVQMLVLFVWAQFLIFTSDNWDCEAASELSSFKIQYKVLMIWIFVQYFKLLMLLVGGCTTICFIKSKFSAENRNSFLYDLCPYFLSVYRCPLGGVKQMR